MKSWEVIAYTADASVFCGKCLSALYGDSPTADREGNPIRPIFVDTEWWWRSDECETLYCSECHYELWVYHKADCVQNFGDEDCDVAH